MPIDLEFVRSQFPAFSEPSLSHWLFFENAGGSFPCGAVTDQLSAFYSRTKMQPYWPAEPSAEGGEAMDRAKSRLAKWLGVTESWLSVGPSTTQNTYVLSKAFGDWLSKGDAIIVTNQDHEANSGPWRRLEARGVEVREWSIDPMSGRLNASGLEALLDGKVKLVAFPHCSNIVGEINPVAEWVGLVHAAGALACVDGVSYAPHGLPNFQALGADIYLFSSYKTFGPHQGIMLMSPDLAEQLPNQGHVFNGYDPTKRLTPAGPDHAQTAALAGMIDYFEAVDAHHYPEFDRSGAPDRVHDLFRAHELELTEQLLAQVDALGRARLIGPREAQHKAPTISLLCDRPGMALAEDLAVRGIIAGGGDFYGGRVLDAMGIDREFGVLRLSFVHYTSAADIENLSSALTELLA